MIDAPTNVLAHGIEIIGQITFKRDMHIDAYIEGSISSETGSITIGEQAVIKGNITAGSVNIYGHVEGDISSKSCHLDSTAVIEGDITTGALSMEHGARLAGRAKIG